MLLPLLFNFYNYEKNITGALVVSNDALVIIISIIAPGGTNIPPAPNEADTISTPLKSFNAMICPGAPALPPTTEPEAITCILVNEPVTDWPFLTIVTEGKEIAIIDISF
jgi:hypothetical protein